VIRLLLALLLIAAALAVAVFFADHPGQVEIVWQGWQIDTSVGVLVAAALLLAAVAWLLALLIAALRRLPRNLRRRRADRRRRSGVTAMTRGLVALAAGQAVEARRHAGRSAAMLEGAPIPLLLLAEAAARQGDAGAAREAYSRLLERPDSEFLGLRGLIGQALRDGEDAAARRLATRALQLRPEAGWLLDTLLVLEARASDWTAAQTTLAAAARRRTLPADRLRHRRGVVLHELSRAAERSGNLAEAAKLAARAQNLAADLAVAGVQHARLLISLARQRAAARAIERAWRRAPHPDLARLYLDTSPADGPLARAAAAQRLAATNPQAEESRLAVAEAALAAQLWGEARRCLDLAAEEAEAGAPSRRVCRLMARLEESEKGDMAAARGWLDRALTAPPDPSYVCAQCGGESADWQPLCRHCGAFDRLQWRRPPPRNAAASLPPVEIGAPLMLPASAMPATGVTANGLAARPQSDI
jgi:HemY protein